MNRMSLTKNLIDKLDRTGTKAAFKETVTQTGPVDDKMKDVASDFGEEIQIYSAEKTTDDLLSAPGQ